MDNFTIESGILISYKGDEEVVRIPEGVIAVEELAFYGNSKMKEIIFPESLREIRRNAFSPCNSLEKLDFPEGLISIGEFAFSCCRKLKEISFPKSLEFIDRSAFSMDWALKEIYLPDNLKSLPRGVFLGCRMLKKVYIGKNVRNIDVDAFSGCTALTGITVSGENEYLSDKEGVLYDKSGKELLLFPGGLPEIEIPDDVSSIGPHAFYENGNVDKLKLPLGLKSIHEAAFYRCTQLMSLPLPEGLKVIGSQAFVGCSKLKSMFVPDGVRVIGESAFRSCRELKWLRVPEKIVFDIHWFCAPNDSGAFSADHTILPFVTNRPLKSIDSKQGIERAAEGFILSQADAVTVKAEIETEYTEFIRKNIEKYYDMALENENILKWFTGKKLIPADDTEKLIARAADAGKAGCGAILLGYQGKLGIKKEEAKPAASKQLEDRFSALENALDF